MSNKLPHANTHNKLIPPSNPHPDNSTHDTIPSPIPNPSDPIIAIEASAQFLQTPTHTQPHDSHDLIKTTNDFETANVLLQSANSPGLYVAEATYRSGDIHSPQNRILNSGMQSLQATVDSSERVPIWWCSTESNIARKQRFHIRSKAASGSHFINFSIR